MELVRAVAESLNLIEETASTEATAQNEYNWKSPTEGFVLSVVSQNGGLWRVDLADWPKSMQSELSKRAEAEIRQRVKTSCSSS